jgi:hypothetical protein
MNRLCPSEETIWSKETIRSNISDDVIEKLNDDQINAQYVKRELRIITEVNREQLPNFVAALD